MRRRSPRAVLLWFGALIVAAVTAVVVTTDLAALHRRAQTFGALRTVAVAARDLSMGTTVRSADLRFRRVHRSQLPVGTLSPGEARGRVVSVAVVSGAYLVDRNLAPRSRAGLEGVLPPGTRALRIVVGDSLRPPVGSSVDVLTTFDPSATNASPTRPTAVAARGVLVLATDAGTLSKPGGLGTRGAAIGGRGIGVTLLVSEDDAERLAFAAATGVVTLALVPPEDAAPVPTR